MTLAAGESKEEEILEGLRGVVEEYFSETTETKDTHMRWTLIASLADEYLAKDMEEYEKERTR